ncbi:hypothetical protein NLI96_g10636 [Meripilus lineatus]|uniref:SUN domain-containing protein n=1 Tax=Meripilus lineatus TaxID=2056292 RepID=A0AAD5UT87_9APHY|nr:hypothetical protein NLI96_g10636 [Physisporinus lineatus]
MRLLGFFKRGGPTYVPSKFLVEGTPEEALTDLTSESSTTASTITSVAPSAPSQSDLKDTHGGQVKEKIQFRVFLTQSSKKNGGRGTNSSRSTKSALTWVAQVVLSTVLGSIIQHLCQNLIKDLQLPNVKDLFNTQTSPLSANDHQIESGGQPKVLSAPGALSKLDMLTKNASVLKKLTFGSLSREAQALPWYTWLYYRSPTHHDDTSSKNPSFQFEDPTVILDPQSVSPRCWSFVGSHGQLVLHLPTPSVIHNLTLEHRVDEAAFLSCAPRQIILWGIELTSTASAFKGSGLQGTLMSRLPLSWNDNPPVVRTSDVLVPMVVANYAPNRGVQHQTFVISEELTAMTFQVEHVVFQVVGNWGHDTTCICHVALYDTQVWQGADGKKPQLSSNKGNGQSGVALEGNR